MHSDGQRFDDFSPNLSFQSKRLYFTNFYRKGQRGHCCPHIYSHFTKAWGATLRALSFNIARQRVRLIEAADNWENLQNEVRVGCTQ